MICTNFILIRANTKTMHNSYFPNTMSSIYANSSDSYWTERQKKHEKKKSPLLLVASTVVFAIAAVGAILHNKHSIARSRTLTQRRDHDQTNDSHWKQCESRVNSRQECTVICQPERNSIHRKTMHQSCLHGRSMCCFVLMK